MSDVPFGSIFPKDKGVPAKDTAEKRTRTSYKIRLRKPDGTVLAGCPNQRAGIQTARAMFDNLEIWERKDGTLELRADGELKATIGK